MFAPNILVSSLVLPVRLVRCCFEEESLPPGG